MFPVGCFAMKHPEEHFVKLHYERTEEIST